MTEKLDRSYFVKSGTKKKKEQTESVGTARALDGGVEKLTPSFFQKPAEKAKSKQTSELKATQPESTSKKDSRSQGVDVGGGRKSTTEQNKGSNRMFGGSSWSFDYDADPVKVATAKKKKEQEKPKLLTTLGGMLKSAGLREASNLTNTAGVQMDRTGGTAATSVYQEQLDAIDRRIKAARKQLGAPDTTESDRRDLLKAIREDQKQRTV